MVRNLFFLGNQSTSVVILVGFFRRAVCLLPLLMSVMIPMLTSCHRETETERLLAEIEGKFDDSITDVQLLLRRLDSIPHEDLDNDRLRMSYGLLRAKGDIYCGDYPKTDSALTSYVEYFRMEDDTPHLFEALILRSFCNVYHRNLLKAMSDAMEVRDIAREERDMLMMAQAEELLMYNFEPVYKHDSVLEHAQKCSAYYAACGRFNKVREYKKYAAVYLNAIGRTDEAVVLMDSILKNTPPTDSASIGEIYNRFVRLYLDQDSLSQAEDAFRKAVSYNGKRAIWRIDWRNVISMFFAAGKIDSVEHYLPIMKDHYYGKDGNFCYYRYRQLLAEARGDYREAYKNIQLVDSIYQYRYNVVVTQSPTIVTSEYYNQKAQQEKQRVESRNTIILVVVVSALIVIFMLVIVIRSGRRRHRERELSDLMEIADLKKQLKSVDIDKSVAEVLFKSGFKFLDTFTTEYFIAKSTGRGTPASLLKGIETQLEKLRSEESLDKISEKIDLLYEGILSKIRVEVPKLKPIDIHFIALKLAGFSPKSICLFLNLSPTNYYTKWQRIRNRVAESSITIPIIGHSE